MASSGCIRSLRNVRFWPIAAHCVRGLALELAPVRVNTRSPGPINNPILGKALGEGREAFIASLEQVLPLHRLGTAEEAGAAAVFLMSNTFMNGAVLNIDGGARLV